MSVATFEPDLVRQPLPPSMAERITLIIDLFDSPFQRLPLEEVSRFTGLPRSTAHRILDQLIALRWLVHAKDGYGLGPRATRLVGAQDHTDLRAAAAPLLHELSLRTDLVVHLAVLDGPEILYLDKVGGRSALTIASRVGGRAPAHATALGKAMLAWLAPEEVDALFPEPMRRFTRATVDDVAELHRQLYAVRRSKGIAYERGECMSGVDCVAVALRGSSGPVGAVSLVAPAGAPLERVAPLVVGAAQRISADLFGGRISG